MDVGGDRSKSTEVWVNKITYAREGKESAYEQNVDELCKDKRPRLPAAC